MTLPKQVTQYEQIERGKMNTEKEDKAIMDTKIYGESVVSPIPILAITADVAQMLLLGAEKYREIKPARIRAVKIKNQESVLIGFGQKDVSFDKGSYLVELPNGTIKLMNASEIEEKYVKLKRQKKI